MFRSIFPSLLCLALLLSAAQDTGASSTSAATGLRRSILALDSAWSMALRDLQEKKQAGTLGETEQDEYARFVTYLGARISEYCNQLRATGDPGYLTGLPCPPESNLEDGADTPPPSSAEQVAALDQSLAEALGSFDEMLLAEEARLSRRLPRQRESGGSLNGSRPGRGNGSGQGGSSGGAGQTGQNSGQDGTGSGEQESGQNGTAGHGSGGSKTGRSREAAQETNQSGAGTGTPRDNQDTMSTIESGYDDIVARQLREAAEKETDPELKEKLWEEYRKYKQGAL